MVSNAIETTVLAVLALQCRQGQLQMVVRARKKTKEFF